MFTHQAQDALDGDPDLLLVLQPVVDLAVVFLTEGRTRTYRNFWTLLPEVEPPVLPTGFHVLPRRWVVERTFAWIGRYRRFSKDLRAALRIRRIADLHRDDTPHAGEVGGIIILKHPLRLPSRCMCKAVLGRRRRSSSERFGPMRQILRLWSSLEFIQDGQTGAGPDSIRPGRKHGQRALACAHTT